MTDARLWIVGKTLNAATQSWEFQGVFGSEEAAEKSCRDHRYFMAPATLNEALSDDQTEWPGAWYPKAWTQPRPAEIDGEPE